jgi:hypothetical protein
MLLPNKKGIKCDLCGKKCESKFIYYSYDCHKVDVDIENMSASREKATDVTGSVIGFDVCESCFKNMITTMLENQKP